MRSITAIFLSFLFFDQIHGATITFSAKSPALVSVHPAIQTLAIIDRTVAKNGKKDQLEGILTGEGMDGDK